MHNPSSSHPFSFPYSCSSALPLSMPSTLSISTATSQSGCTGHSLVMLSPSSSSSPTSTSMPTSRREGLQVGSVSPVLEYVHACTQLSKFEFTFYLYARAPPFPETLHCDCIVKILVYNTVLIQQFHGKKRKDYKSSRCANISIISTWGSDITHLLSHPSDIINSKWGYKQNLWMGCLVVLQWAS